MLGGIRRPGASRPGISLPGLCSYLPQHFLYFRPLPHGHESFLPVFGGAINFPLIALRANCLVKSIRSTEGTRNVNVVLPKKLLTAKSPREITSIPISTSQPIFPAQSVTSRSGMIILFGKCRLMRKRLQVSLPVTPCISTSPISSS